MSDMKFVGSVATTRAFIRSYFSPEGVRTLGTPTVSQKALRRAVVAGVRAVTRTGIILETGAGDGALTVSLAQALPGHSVVAVEVMPLLANKLRARGLPILVWEMSAADILERWRAEFGDQAPGVILSGLPFRSLPPEVTQKTLEAYRALLPQGGCVVQYTYFPEYLASHPWSGFRVKSLKRVWNHLPPAGVVILERLA